MRFSFGGYFAVCLPREFGPQGIYIADGEDRGERVVLRDWGWREGKGGRYIYTRGWACGRCRHADGRISPGLDQRIFKHCRCRYYCCHYHCYCCCCRLLLVCVKIFCRKNKCSVFDSVCQL